jgi:hypothetical protein
MSQSITIGYQINFAIKCTLGTIAKYGYYTVKQCSKMVPPAFNDLTFDYPNESVWDYYDFQPDVAFGNEGTHACAIN